MLAAVRADFPDIELTVDANSAYTLDDDRPAAPDRRVRPALHRAAAALGRPGRSRHAGHRCCTPTICLDETLTSPARVRAALDLEACTVVNVKVGRVGGLHGRAARSTTCAWRAACRCGAAACSRPASAGPTTSTSPPCPASCTPATPRRPAAPTPATSPSSSSRPPTASCPCPTGPASASPSTAPFLDEVTEQRRGRSARRADASSSASCAPPTSWRCCRAFEARIWGGGDDRVSVNMLVATHRGRRHGHRRVRRRPDRRCRVRLPAPASRDVLHSHYMAVDPEYRRSGPGRSS